MDTETTIGQLRDEFARFVAERDWEQFHSPKNLSMSLAIEAAELMEHFQWISMAESRLLADSGKKRDEVAAEMADVLCYLLGMANSLDVDLATAFRKKMIRNAKKYPTSRFKGRFE